MRRSRLSRWAASHCGRDLLPAVLTRWTLAGFLGLAALGAVALSVGVAEAGKPGSGGPIPPGTIYFESGGGRWSMNPDGSGKTALPTSVHGVPSNQVHGGAHWFLYSQSGQLHATREDGSSDVQLTSEAANGAAGHRWGRYDSFVSFIGTDAPIGSSVRIFRVDIAFDASGVPSAAGGPVAVSGIAEIYGFPHTWSPSGDRVAWRSSDSLNVTTVATGATTSIASNTGYAGAGLAWSPDGARILFGTGREIHTIDPSGANRQIIVGDMSGDGGKAMIVATVAADWSPDSAGIAYGRYVYELQRYRERRGLPWEYYYDLVAADVYRASADGSATQDLTSETSNMASPIAWR